MRPIPINRPIWTDSDLERHGLPRAAEAERMILGSLLAGYGDMSAIQDVIEPDDFSTDANRRIFAAAKTVHERLGRVDRVTVIQELLTRKQLESVGGMSVISGLDEGIPHLPDLSAYLKVIREKSVRRQIIAGCHSLINRCLIGPEDATEVLVDGEKLLADLTQRSETEDEFYTLEQVVEAAGGIQEYMERRKKPGVMSGWSELDHYTRGWLPGELIILAGGPSTGKSACAQNIALHMAQNDIPVAIFSMEMGKDELTDRVACIAGGLDLMAMRRGECSLEFSHALSKICNIPLYLRDKAHCTIAKIAASLRKLKARKGIQFAIVDYLQLLSSATNQRAENRTQEVSAFSRGLKMISQELKIPIMALSQLNRRSDVEKRPPALHDLRESGSIEQDANGVFFLHPENPQDDLNPWQEVKLIIAKQRNGARHHKGIEMVFHGPSFRFCQKAS